MTTTTTQMNKVYCIYKNFNDELFLEEAEILMKGKKVIKLTKSLSGFGYRVQIPLNEASFTPADAWNKYIAQLEKVKEGLEKEIYDNEILLHKARVRRSLLTT